MRRGLIGAAIGALMLGGCLTAGPAATACCFDNDNTIVGTGKADYIRGTAEGDDIYVRGGNDTVEGRGGHDLIYGGKGADDLAGEAGPDRVFGGGGGDILDGVSNEADPAFDVLHCGAGRDVAVAGPEDRVSSNCEVVRRPAS